MSFGIDVNILLYASDQSSPKHARAAAYLQSCAADGQVFCLAWLTLMSYLRMATHPRIFARPLSHADAVRNVEALMALPHCRVLGEQEGFWDTSIATSPVTCPLAATWSRMPIWPRCCGTTASPRSTPTTATSAGSRSSRCATPWPTKSAVAFA